ACEISTRALTDLYEGPLAGRTERAIARDLESRMLDLGADGIAFETILATGPNSAIPHHAPTNRVTKKGDLLKIDFGALVGGYHADCTRTVVLGAAQDWQREIYAAVRASQQAGVDALVAGNPIGASKVAADAALADAGWLEHFTTGLGHGVGLQIHEDPFLHTDHTGKLIPCMTLTMEPGVYLPGRGGVRIEDTLVITGGAAEALTAMTKDLLELA
ncbi:MAG: peptidase family protein, partial [Nocardioidaceae bacterium]|nr:peptidase family protein [Nocardioidaceae bacterium]